MSIPDERAALAGQGLDIAWRETWGAVEDYTSPRPVEQAQWLFLHIAVVDDPSDLVGDEHVVMRKIEAIGQARFGIGCSYNAAAFDTGRLYEAQPLERRGAHTVNDLDPPNPLFPAGGLNHLVRALVLPQNVEHLVRDPQIDSAARWGAALCRAGFAAPGAVWYGHRDVTQKSCPGPIAYARLEELNELTRHYEAHGLQEDDMPLNDADKQWIGAALTEALGPRTKVNVADRSEVWKWVREIRTGVATLLGRNVDGGLDEAAVAAEVVKLLSPTLPALTDTDLDRIAKAVADEQAERLAT